MNKRTAKQIACHQAAWRMISDRDSGTFGADSLSDEDNARIVDAVNELIDELARRSGPWWERGKTAINTEVEKSDEKEPNNAADRG